MKGKCVNLDCPEFDKIQDIPDGADFVCKNPECNLQLHEVTGNENNSLFVKFKMPLIIAAIVIVAGIVCFFLLNKKVISDSQPDENTEVVDSTQLVINNDPVQVIKDTVVIQKTDTVISQKTDTVVIQKTDTVVIKEVPVPPDGKTPPTEKKYSFGKYSGSLHNGYPDGQGTMVYTKRVRIAKHDNKEHYAEAGYSLVGTWINGDISNGKLIDRNGNMVEVIMAGARNSIYDLENDNK